MKSLTESPYRYALVAFSMASILRIAFQLPSVQIIVPSWVNDVYFSIEAKLPDGAVRERDGNAMLRTLLAERFGATFHREVRNGRVAILERTGTELRLPSAGQAQPFKLEAIGKTTATSRAQFQMTISGTVDDFLPYLGGPVGLPTLNQTGLKGIFHFDIIADALRPKGDPFASNSAHNLEIFNDAIRPLGLRLRLSSGPVDVVVIDQLSRVPTEN